MWKKTFKQHIVLSLIFDEVIYMADKLEKTQNTNPKTSKATRILTMVPVKLAAFKQINIVSVISQGWKTRP